MSSPNVVAHTFQSPLLIPKPRRISDQTLAAVKAIPIIDVIGPVVSLRRSGSRFVGKCPFHEEKTASFSVDPNKSLYHCFGCGVGGDLINFVMRMEGCEFVTAVRTLADRFGIEVKRGVVDHSIVAILDELREIDERIQRILVNEQIQCGKELERLRVILRTRTFDSIPANIYDQLRRADTHYVLVALTTQEDAVLFLSASPADQEKRISEALEEDGCVRSGKYFWEVPTQ